MTIEFWTTLIKVTRRPTPEQRSELEANCTHVTGPHWIMEGETDYLREQGIRFREVGQGAVGCLGDIKGDEEALKLVCLESYGVRL